MGLLENQSAVLTACLLTVPVAAVIAVFLPDASMAAMFLLAAASVFVRFVENKALKVLCYILLGFISFWIAGNALFVPLGMEVQLFSFIPFLFLGAANAAAALVAYNDGYISGLIFASASLISIMLTRGPLDAGGIDRFIITAIAFAIASCSFVLFATWAKNAKWAAYNALKASVVAGFIYGIVYIMRLYDVNALNFSDPMAAYAKLSGPFLNILWISLVANFFMVALALLTYELALYLFSIRRNVKPDSVVLVEFGKEVPEKDPYSPLVARLEKFFRDFSNYDVDQAASVLSTMETEYYALSRSLGDAPLKQNAGKMLMEARSLLLGLKLESERPAQIVPQAEAQKPRRKRGEFEIPRGTVVLLEGPIGSRKEEFGLEMLKKAFEEGRKCAIVSFEPEKESEYLDAEGLQLVKVEQNINDMALAISRALEDNPEFIFFNILYWLVPNHGISTISAFLASTARKVKKVGATAVFVMENAMVSPQELSTLESLFDGILEFVVSEEGGVQHSRYRVKEFKFKKFDSDWREHW